METPVEEIDSLLDEIPRATSAPPYFKNFSQESATSSTDVLFERKFPTSLSDSLVMLMEENPNPNPNPTDIRSPCCSQGPGIMPRIPQASPKQQNVAAFQDGRLLCGDELIVRDSLARLSLQGKETDSLRMLLDNRNHIFTSNSLSQNFSELNPSSSASYGNAMSHLSSLSAPSLIKSLSVPAPRSSTLHPFASSKLLDQPYSQEGQLNHASRPATNVSPDSDVFQVGSKFLEDELAMSLSAKKITMRQGFGQQIAKQLVSQEAYEWASSLEKSSYFAPLVEDICGSAASPVIVSKRPVCRTGNSRDLYEENWLTTRFPDFTPDGNRLALIERQKIQLARHTMEEVLNMQQLQTDPNASLYDQHPPYTKTADYPTYVTNLEELPYNSGFVSAAHESALLGNDSDCRLHPQGHWARGRNFLSSYPGACGEGAPFMHFYRESFAGAGCYARQDGLAVTQAFQHRCLESNGNNSELSGIPACRRRKEKTGFLVGDGSQLLEERASIQSSLDEGREPLQQFLNYTSLKDLEGNIFDIAKDQHGCRFLQRMLDEAKSEDVEMIFQEISKHVVQLMIDPFGNYLVQKLLDSCNESHLTAILEAVAKNDDLVNVSLNMHGTRAVQKLVETLQTPDQIAILISSLKRGVVALIRDLNGNHVVQRCLQRLDNEKNQFIYDAVASHCMVVASHRHGCCVLQRCVDFATNAQQRQLVTEIANNALALSQDQYGNYVVQYILDLGLPWALVAVVSRLEGSFSHLSMQKFSSNVVEKCLKVATEESKSLITKELVSSSAFSQLLQDPFANYVIQSALQVTKGYLHAIIIDAIKPHVHALRSSPFGKRILSRTQFKK